MAKRGRKPKEVVRKGYFYEEEEQALREYIKSTDPAERNAIYNKTLRPAFETMVEALMHRYRLHVPDEEYKQTFNDTITDLLTKVNKFDPNRETKAYSYCGTVAKHFLYSKVKEYTKKIKKNVTYDTTMEDLGIASNYNDNEFRKVAEVLVTKISDEIRKIINDDTITLKPNEVKVGMALCELFDNWESLLDNCDGSRKLTKRSVLYFLREETMLTTKELRDNMKPFKKAYYILKNAELEN